MAENVGTTKLTPASDPRNAIANAISGNDLFMVRLANEQKLHEYQAFRKQKIDGGMAANDATRAAKNQFGWLGHKAERQAYVDAMNGNLQSLNESNAERSRRSRDKQRNAPFEKALAQLPSSASVEVEVDWVRSHPAMARRARKMHHPNSREGSILLVAEDLLSETIGVCPSRSAAILLQNWVNAPDKFFSDILKEQKKGLKGNRIEEEGGADERNIAADIDDILSSLGG